MLKSLQRQIPRKQLKHENLLKIFLHSQKTSKIVYRKVIANVSEKPTLSTRTSGIKMSVLQVTKTSIGEKFLRQQPHTQRALN